MRLTFSALWLLSSVTVSLPGGMAPAAAVSDDGGARPLQSDFFPGAGSKQHPLYLSEDTSNGWIDVTSNAGGPTWGEYGVTLVTSVPGKDAVIAGISQRGLWLSIDRGATWKHLGDHDAVQIDNRPGIILFDPKDTNAFWEVGCYGKGLFRTTDGGATFKRLGGNLAHTDSIAVDFGDPQRKTIIVGMHEKIRSLEKSTDGGETFENIGVNMPENSNFDDEAIMIDTNTYITNAAGWWPNTSNTKFTWGIFRTDDGGKTWEKISDFGPGTKPMFARDGAIYWGLTWGGGVIRSADNGKTWTKLKCPLRSCPIELPGGRLVGFANRQLYISSDGGKSWTKFLDPLPWNANGLTYCEKGESLYAWQLVAKKQLPAIVRHDVR